jgi:hypothetical protein
VTAWRAETGYAPHSVPHSFVYETTWWVPLASPIEGELKLSQEAVAASKERNGREGVWLPATWMVCGVGSTPFVIGGGDEALTVKGTTCGGDRHEAI